MGKNILIFSDGTGQAGGLLPDELRTNVYKLFRATRCGPDIANHPEKQLAFYDPGIGTQVTNEVLKPNWVRWLQNLFSKMTGLGITTNIIDCYSAIIQLWQPGDRIYLFGFSRGAYTARCIGGVLALCGVPRAKDGVPIKLDPSSARAIATEAVKHVYQHGASKKQERFKRQREALAATFRKKYTANDSKGQSNAIPYFIGIWDTVAALGASWMKLIGFGVITVIFCGIILFGFAVALSYLFGFLIPWSIDYWVISLSVSFSSFLTSVFSWFKLLFFSSVALVIISYLYTHIKFALGTGDPVYKTLHVVFWRFKFYDTNLDDRVCYARHALSIDENRKDFDRVIWTNIEGIHSRKINEIIWFEQIWFAGNHSDIGGGYPENESRLSDIALQWIVNEAMKLPYPIHLDQTYLRLSPSAGGIGHDACKEIIGGLRFLHWSKKNRHIPIDAYLHPTVFERLVLPEVQNYDEFGKYDPEPLRNRSDFKRYAPYGPLYPQYAQPDTEQP